MYLINLNFRKSFLFVICLLLFGCVSNNNQLINYVDPFIGTENGGHTFVGTTVPFGMVKLGPDYGERQSNSGYYEPFFLQRQNGNNPNNDIDSLLREKNNKRIQGFSHVHVSGTGGGPKYGNILIKPSVGNIEKLILNYSSYRDSHSETARPGYYSVILNENNNIKVELTSTNNVGFHRYTFSKTDSAYILFDITSFLGKYHCCNENQELVDHAIKIIDNQSLCGYQTVKGGWNKGKAYTVYFYTEIDKKANSFGAWHKDNIYIPTGNVLDTLAQGVFYRYNFTIDTTINLKVGISFLSIEKAKKNLEDDNNTFDQALLKTQNLWESYLSKIIVETQIDSLKTIFYTALYHSFLMPVNRTGENPNWTSNNPYYDDFYAIWDTYRTLHPLFTLIAPDKQIEIIQTLIDIYENELYMPDARSGNYNGRTQGGSNCDILISEAYLKKLGINDINYQKAFEAMIKNAEKIPIPDIIGLNRNDTVFYTQKEGRYVNDFYKSKGYFPANYYKNSAGKYVFSIERPASRTLEYAFCDWAISNIADDILIDSIKEFFPEDFNFDNIKSYYSKKSENWKNIWNDNIECDGIIGFIAPKNSNGYWMDTIPDKHNVLTKYSCILNGSWSGFFYESNAWENSLFVPHDINGLIDKCGGVDNFEKRLDIFFNNNYYNVKNEPSFLAPCLYLYINKRDKAILQIKNILNEHYNDTRGGIPGNDDSGAMSSWFIFHSIGLYPNAGDSTYLITEPLFNSVTINLPDNKQFIIKRKNISKYNGEILLNDTKYEDFLISHRTFLKGGCLEIFTKGEK